MRRGDRFRASGLIVILGLLDAFCYGLAHDAMADLRPHLEFIRSDAWLLAAWPSGLVRR